MSAVVRWVAVLAAGLLVSGCAVVSLHPLYEEQQLVSIPNLTGSWIATVGGAKYTFQRSRGSLYRVTLDSGDPELPLIFKAGLIRLGEYLFLDITADDPAIGRYVFYVIPVHIFCRIWVERNAFLTRCLDRDWFDREVRAGRIDLAYVRMADLFLLTAPTRDLQRFALQYATNGEAFPRASTETYVIETP